MEAGLDMVSVRLVTDHRVGAGIRIRVPEDAVRLVSDVIGTWTGNFSAWLT